MPGEPAYAVIGDPIAHSLSPSIFAWLFAQLDVAGRYDRLRVSPPELPAALARLRSGEYAGYSVTLPHKQTVAASVDGLDPLARRVGAVNCVAATPEGLVGFNTDVEGFRHGLEEGGATLEDARVVVLGAGGAARAVVAAAVAFGARSVAVANRSTGRAESLVDEGRGWAATEPRATRLSVIPLEPEPVSAALEEADLLINATSVGLSDPASGPLPEGTSPRAGQKVMDLVYRPLRTALLRQAEAASAEPIDGLWMLVHQALEQLRIWTGRAAPKDAAHLLHRHLQEGAT